METFEYPVIRDKLTWEKINAFPVKRADMSIEEMRQLCVDFLRFTKTALWTPDADITYAKNRQGKPDSVNKGSVYGGLPYITLGSGSVYRLMDYLDEETGVVDMRHAAKAPHLFGNQCSGATFWAWGRFINSVKYRYTVEFVTANGFLRVGPYTYDDSRESFSPEYTTVGICETNGEQVMFQSYAALQPADGLVNYTTGGHVLMCSGVPHVEYIEGTDRIDGEKSYVTEIEQAQKWLEAENESGDTYLYKSNVDIRRTFSYLFQKGYLPFTYGEFLGTDSVEETECRFSFTGDVITTEELFSSTVTANYGISDVYATVKDGSGKEVYRHAVRMVQAGHMSLEMSKDGVNAATWGTLDVSGGGFTVEVVCQLATGERPTIYTGRLVP